MAFVLDESDLELIIEAKRLRREGGHYEPDPPVPAALRQQQLEYAKTLSTYHFTCPCGCPVATRVISGSCPSCHRLFDLSGWGAA